jgi:hypothetical protein
LLVAEELGKGRAFRSGSLVQRVHCQGSDLKSEAACRAGGTARALEVLNYCVGGALAISASVASFSFDPALEPK